MPYIPSLKQYARHYPNPRLEKFYAEVDRFYDWYGNMVELHPTSKHASTIITNPEYPLAMREEALALAKKVLAKQEQKIKENAKKVSNIA